MGRPYKAQPAVVTRPGSGSAPIRLETGSDSLFFLNRHDADFAVIKESAVLPRPRRGSTRPPSVCNRLFLHDAAFGLIPLKTRIHFSSERGGHLR